MVWFKTFFVIAVAYFAFKYFGRVDKETIRGKRVLITGASQNIGEEIAYQYAKLGATLVITARRENALRKVTDKCKALGAKDASYLVADMSSGEEYEALINDAVKKMGGLDILVLNHVKSIHRIWDGSADDIAYLENSMPVNYFSYVRLSTAAMPHLSRSKGQLIVLGSQAGRPALPNTAAYGATKAAIINFFSSLQMERKLKGLVHPSITVCILGAIDTKEARWAMSDYKTNISPYSVSDTASDIIEGGITGSRYIYAPFYLRFMQLAREISPDIFDSIILRLVYGV